MGKLAITLLSLIVGMFFLERGGRAEDTELRLRQANQQVALGHLPEAIATYNAILARDSESSAAYAGRAAVYVLLKNKAQALADYDAAIKLDDWNAEVRFRRGKLLKELGELNRAVDDFSRAVELEPRQANALFERGEIFAQLRRPAEAVRDLKAAALTDPSLAPKVAALISPPRPAPKAANLAKADNSAKPEPAPAPVMSGITKGDDFFAKELSLPSGSTLVLNGMTLSLGANGNLRLLKSNGTVVWDARAFHACHDRCVARLEADGNFALYDDARHPTPEGAYWSTLTQGKRPLHLLASRSVPFLSLVDLAPTLPGRKPAGTDGGRQPATIWSSPCNSIDIVNCQQAIPVTLPGTQGEPGKLEVYRNYDLDTKNSAITKLVVTIHGSEGDFGGMFEEMLNLYSKPGDEKSTLIVSPNFHHAPNKENFLYWNTGTQDWAIGRNSLEGQEASSYEVLDWLIQRIVSSGSFPNLKQVVITGFSAGGQFLARYSLLSPLDERLKTVKIRYVAASSGTYLYLDDRRFVPGPAHGHYQFKSLPPPKACRFFNYYRYGLDGLDKGPTAAPYVNRQAGKIRDRLAKRDIVIMVGGNDSYATHMKNVDDLDKTCMAELQGKSRLERALIYQDYLALLAKNKRVPVITVPGFSHDPTIYLLPSARFWMMAEDAVAEAKKP